MLKQIEANAYSRRVRRVVLAFVVAVGCSLGGTIDGVADDGARIVQGAVKVAQASDAAVGAMRASMITSDVSVGDLATLPDLGQRALFPNRGAGRSAADVLIDDQMLRDPPIKMPVSTWALSFLGAGFLWLVIRRRSTVALGASGGQ